MHQAFARLVPYDRSLDQRPESQRWYSGQQFSVWYNAMLAEFAAGLREYAPQAQLVAGWGFHQHQGEGQQSWVPWKTLHKSLIDQQHAVINGIHEHHYGGVTRVVAADYETRAAYAQHADGVRLGGYNTEAGANFDQQRPGTQRSVTEKWFARFGSADRQQAMMAYHYFVRDVVYMVDRCPDKALARGPCQPRNQEP